MGGSRAGGRCVGMAGCSSQGCVETLLSFHTQALLVSQGLAACCDCVRSQCQQLQCAGGAGAVTVPRAARAHTCSAWAWHLPAVNPLHPLRVTASC